MTVSLEHLTDVPAVRGMTEQHSLVDPYDEPHAVIGLRIVVTRDHLAAGVEMGVNGDSWHPDELTVAQVRYFAESFIVTESALEIQRGAEAMAQMAEPDFYDRAVHEHVMACYRAVDRAYPKAL